MTAAYERRELKHRASGETRPVPIHSELVTLIRDHMKEYRAGHGGRIFSLPRGGIVTDRASVRPSGTSRSCSAHPAAQGPPSVHATAPGASSSRAVICPAFSGQLN
jgi:hypothetical protein